MVAVLACCQAKLLYNRIMRAYSHTSETHLSICLLSLLSTFDNILHYSTFPIDALQNSKSIDEEQVRQKCHNPQELL